MRHTKQLFIVYLRFKLNLTACLGKGLCLFMALCVCVCVCVCVCECVCVYVCLPHHVAFRISVPQPGVKPGPQWWTYWILMTRLPGNSPACILKKYPFLVKMLKFHEIFETFQDGFKDHLVFLFAKTGNPNPNWSPLIPTLWPDDLIQTHFAK